MGKVKKSSYGLQVITSVLGGIFEVTDRMSLPVLEYHARVTPEEEPVPAVAVYKSVPN